jgi:hypothetical protein
VRYRIRYKIEIGDFDPAEDLTDEEREIIQVLNPHHHIAIHNSDYGYAVQDVAMFSIGDETIALVMTRDLNCAVLAQMRDMLDKAIKERGHEFEN